MYSPTDEFKLNHPLDAIYAKIQRANENIQNLNMEITDYLTREPRPYRIVGKINDDGLKYVFKAFGSPTPPIRFAVLAGEVIQHLRACLDYLVVALAAENGQRPLNNHQFPVCRTLEKFEKACRGGNIKGISDAAMNQIAKAQPYAHSTPDAYTLTILHEFNIRDKHRLLLVVSTAAKIGSNIEVGGTERNRPPIEIVGLGQPGPRIVSEEGEEIFSITLGKPAPDFYANADFVGQIAFNKCGPAEVVPVVPTLTKMSGFVTRLVADFSAEFR